jgi:NAD(P)H dehydrogenase (quinone)
VLQPEGLGKIAFATIDDLAAGNVAVLTQDGHKKKTYTLSGSDGSSFVDIAEALSEMTDFFLG